MRRLLLILCLLLPALAATAEPRSYRLDPAGSEVRFGYAVGGVPGEGVMPVKSARMAIDFARLERSKAEVVLDVPRIRASSQMITDALKGESMLHAAAYPEIRFVSSKVSGSVRDGATISGMVTIRGVTRPLALKAQLYRPPDSAEGDLSRLTVLLTGTINRHDFGADGYGELVSGRVDLRIRAQLAETGG
ncbi:YceI family protein [Mangrovicoccus sp. HB161399]|uniref:YceI family protein n=1 Tax=Mangrovicoccus sp. HB161399 TaxID=2720392 RepID=UPI001553B9D3|nr:YceI family protein [Mangrovicoccus sp. HB161399]